MIRCQVQRHTLSREWLLSFSQEILPFQVERALQNLGAVFMRPCFFMCSNAVTKEDIVRHLYGVCDLWFDGEGPAHPPEPNPKVKLGGCRLWEDRYYWVIDIDHNATVSDQAVLELVLGANRKSERRYTLEKANTREDVLSILKNFYVVTEGPAQEPPKAKDADAEKVVRRAYERWCRTNGIEPRGGWQTEEAPIGANPGYTGWHNKSPFDDIDWGKYGDPFAEARRREREARERDHQRQSAPPPRRGDSTDPYRAMLEGLPHATLKKIYRLIAVEHHPDKGGDGEILKRVNAAWDKLKKQLGMD